MDNDDRSPEARRLDDAWQAYVAELRGGPERPFAEQWARWQELHANRQPEDGPPIAWQPDAKLAGAANVAKLQRDLGLASYGELQRWSAANRERFWSEAITRLGIVFATPPTRTLDPSSEAQDPRWLPGARLNIALSCFRSAADAPAILSGREGTRDITVTTVGELERLTRQVAQGLVAHGFAPDDAIALYMPMTLECVAAYLGIIRAGMRVVSIADSFSPGEVARRLRIADAKAVLTVHGYTRAGRTIALHDKVVEAGASRIIVIPDPDRGLPPLRSGDLSWSKLLGAGEMETSVLSPPDGVVNVLFSSGTTGDPKAIPWTHLTPIKCAMDGHFHHDIGKGDVVAWPTNIGWMMGPWLIFASLMNRAAMALYEGSPGGEGFIRFIADAKVTMLGVVPSLVRAWRAADLVRAGDFASVRAFSSTGEPSNREDYLWLMSRARYQAPVIEYLGGTEIGGGHITGTVVQPASPSTFTTPALGLDFVILDEGGKPVSEGENGELFLVPPSVGLSQRLLNRDHAEVYYADCPRGPRGQALRRHGDVMERMHHGFFRAQGRADDTMNLGGIKVSSLELERVLEGESGVYESAAIAVQPTGEGADALVVYVVLAKPRDSSDLRRALGQRLARELNPLFKIHDVVVIDKLPRTASNKLMRRELRAAYRAGTA